VDVSEGLVRRRIQLRGRSALQRVIAKLLTYAAWMNGSRVGDAVVTRRDELRLVPRRSVRSSLPTVSVLHGVDTRTL
jgi:hypothetical protein